MTKPEDHIKFMNQAIKMAKKSALLGEVPIGAVIVYKDKVIASGWNLRESKKNPLLHAEVMAIQKASSKLDAWRLLETTLYVTLEPCLMCAGAIYQARIPKVVFGALDPKAGACGSLYCIHEDSRLNHRFLVESGVLAEDCSQILKDFFRERRKKVSF